MLSSLQGCSQIEELWIHQNGKPVFQLRSASGEKTHYTGTQMKKLLFLPVKLWIRPESILPLYKPSSFFNDSELLRRVTESPAAEAKHAWSFSVYSEL